MSCRGLHGASAERRPIRRRQCSRSCCCSNGTGSRTRARKRLCAIGCRSGAFAASRSTRRRRTIARFFRFDPLPAPHYRNGGVFLIMGSIMYLFGCFQGSVEALRSIQQPTHFSDFVISHSHLTVFGTFVVRRLRSSPPCYSSFQCGRCS